MNDKEGRKWLLKKLYESKYRYIFRADNHKIYVTISKPVTVDGVYYKQADCGLTMKLMSAICPLFDDIRSFISISEELGIVNWDKVAVDTPIVVDLGNGTKLKRHFAKCDGCSIYYYKKGKTSWTFDDVACAHKSMVSLAGGNDEN